MLKKRSSMLRQMAALILLVGIMQGLGIVYDVYYRLWWWDIPTHFFGGAFAGLTVIWFYLYSGYWPWRNDKVSPVKIVGIALFLTLVIAVSWEVYEYIVGPFYSYGSYAFDTAKDLVMGLSGSLVYSLYFVKSQYDKNE